jgi:hypothetical protein
MFDKEKNSPKLVKLGAEGRQGHLCFCFPEDRLGVSEVYGVSFV